MNTRFGDREGVSDFPPAIMGGQRAIGVGRPSSRGLSILVDRWQTGNGGGLEGVGDGRIGAVVEDFVVVGEPVPVGVRPSGISAILILREIVQTISIGVAILTVVEVVDAIMVGIEAMFKFPCGWEVVVILVIVFRSIAGVSAVRNEGARLAGRLPGEGNMIIAVAFLVEDFDVIIDPGSQVDGAGTLGGEGIEVVRGRVVVSRRAGVDNRGDPLFTVSVR